MSLTKCPKCNGEYMTADYFETKDFDEVLQPVQCDRCGFKWNDIYCFSRSEDEEGTQISLSVKTVMQTPTVSEHPFIIRAVEEPKKNNGEVMVIAGILIMIFACLITMFGAMM